MVHRFGIFESLCDVSVKEHHIRAGFVLLMMLSTNTRGKIVLGSGFVILD